MSGRPDQGPDVSHADLRGTGTGLGLTGATWLEAVADLRAGLEDDPWGDGPGTTVHAAYLAVTEKALEVCEALGERQVTSGEGVHAMEANYQAAERRGEEESARIRRFLESGA
ncbi:hypothetical protein ACIBEJ_36130 [Nonomuraea sp. NPDC050790]|uniref:hypothetical protein n=1 Tax=Nonomuraea sp. NPDC050790 TaxID=3364371 RepID=UPI0037BA170A